MLLINLLVAYRCTGQDPLYDKKMTWYQIGAWTPVPADI